MGDRVTIAGRFNGPPRSGHGGYSAGLFSRFVSGDAEVTLRRPVPLDAALDVTRDHDRVAVSHANDVIAEIAERPNETWPHDVPPLPNVDAARRAGARSQIRSDPDRHPARVCFACGPERAAGDGLHIWPGGVEGARLAADVWRPSEALDAPDGLVPNEFVWAALDCSSIIGAMEADGHRFGDETFVLGRIAAVQRAPVPLREPVVVSAWPIERDGRKLATGSSLSDDAGRVLAVARETWIEVADSPF